MQTRSSPSIFTLHSLAKQASIPGFETLPKALLFQRLRESFDIDRLQRVEARRKRLQEECGKKRSYGSEECPAVSSSSRKRRSVKKVQPINKLCPIMFTAIGKKNIWKYVRSNGNVVAFNAETLADYILSTGDFTDPETRVSFAESDLKEVDEILKKAGVQKQSLLEAKRNTNFFADFKFRRDALLGLERCAGEVVTEILTIIETCDPDEAQMRLIMRELPAFSDYYRQLKEADPAFARQCMAHWKLYLEGPPNRPNDDLYGLIEIVCHFFKICEPSITHTPSSSNSYGGGFGHSGHGSGHGGAGGRHMGYDPHYSTDSYDDDDIPSPEVTPIRSPMRAASATSAGTASASGSGFSAGGAGMEASRATSSAATSSGSAATAGRAASSSSESAGDSAFTSMPHQRTERATIQSGRTSTSAPSASSATSSSFSTGSAPSNSAGSSTRMTRSAARARSPEVPAP